MDIKGPMCTIRIIMAYLDPLQVLSITDSEFRLGHGSYSQLCYAEVDQRFW